MAEDIFAKIGDIKGESIDKKHKDEVDVVSWSWDISPTIAPTPGSGGTSGKASFGNVLIAHRIDKASTPLLAACATGKHFAEARISVRKAAGEYLIVKMKDVMIARVTQGSADDNAETVSLVYGKVDFEYRPQQADGSLDAGVHFRYDVKNDTLIA
jgi:type VI secretion system secreted protein Hcp